MRFVLTALFISGTFAVASAQDTTVRAQDTTVSVQDTTRKAEETFSFVDERPEFPGGDEALMKYIKDNVKYPAIMRDKGVEGKVYIRFVVNKEGYVEQVTLLKGTYFMETKKGQSDVEPKEALPLADEAMRVIRSMPRWKPGKQNGKVVNVMFTLPINFRLN